MPATLLPCAANACNNAQLTVVFTDASIGSGDKKPVAIETGQPIKPSCLRVSGVNTERSSGFQAWP